MHWIKIRNNFITHIFDPARLVTKKKKIPVINLTKIIEICITTTLLHSNARAPFEDQYFVVKERETETERVKERERVGMGARSKAALTPQTQSRRKS